MHTLKALFPPEMGAPDADVALAGPGQADGERLTLAWLGVIQLPDGVGGSPGAQAGCCVRGSGVTMVASLEAMS
jgi:hypothetical protein